MPGWLHGICECCGEPDPPPPPPFCPIICNLGGQGQVNHLIVGASFTPCPPRACQAVSQAPCPAIITCTEVHHGATAGTHIVPATQCANGVPGSCQYFKPIVPLSAIQQGWQDACAGQVDAGPFSCPTTGGAKPCANSPASDGAIAYIVGSYGLGALTVAIWDFSTYSCPARCPQGGCGTCIDIETRQIGVISITGAELQSFCSGATITRTTNQPLACSATGNPTCNPGFPGRYFTGQLVLTLTKG